MKVGLRFATGSISPVPLKLAVCGLPAALSVTVIEALLGPVAVGVKATVIVHDPAPVSEVPQVFVWAKSPLLAPVMAIWLMLRGAVPISDKVIVWEALVV